MGKNMKKYGEFLQIWGILGEFLQPRARGGDRGRYYLLYEEERKIFAKIYLM